MTINSVKCFLQVKEDIAREMSIASIFVNRGKNIRKNMISGMQFAESELVFAKYLVFFQIWNGIWALYSQKIISLNASLISLGSILALSRSAIILVLGRLLLGLES